MNIDLDKPEYEYLKIGLCDYCLLRNIIKKQYDHCKRYPNDVRTIRYMYEDYPEYGSGSKDVMRFILYVQHFLNKLIWCPTDKELNINLFKQIYSYGNENPDEYFFDNIKTRLDAINTEIIHTLNKYYDFNTNRITFSNYIIPFYFKIAIKQGVIKTMFDRDEFNKSKLFKTYMANNYELSYSLDDYDIKLNGKFWDQYTEESVKSLLDNDSLIDRKPAGVDI